MAMKSKAAYYLSYLSPDRPRLSGTPSAIILHAHCRNDARWDVCQKENPRMYQV